MANEPMLTSGQAAEIVGVTDETIRRWAEDGKVRHVRLPSGRLRFHRADIDALLEPVEPAEAAS
jgi:excisionase family DNA binding protein